MSSSQFLLVLLYIIHYISQPFFLSFFLSFFCFFRTKMKQTEVDCEFLKKCCETLTNENRRLQKELQELKALKLAHPLYMHMPAATLTMCPSCERVGGVGVGVGDGASKPKFSMAPKPHFYNPFSNPSAAC